MKRYSWLTTIISFVFVFGLTTFIIAQEIKETIELENTFGKVILSHKTHSGLTECKACHHMGETSQKCESCHTKDAKLNLQNAMHKNCIDCHKEKAKGPTGCMDCHKK